MNLLKRTILGAITGGWAVWFVCCEAPAQAGGGAAATPKSSARTQWEQRVLRHSQAAYPNNNGSTAPQYRIASRLASGQGTISGTTTPAEDVEYDPLGGDPGYGAVELPAQQMNVNGPNCGNCGDCGNYGHCVDGGQCATPGGCGCCDSAGVCDGCYGGHPYTCNTCGPCCGPGLFGIGSGAWLQDLSLFAGAHGFKGPPDRGRNGNFGLHEGINYGAPLGGPLGWGFQVGFSADYSNFSGDQAYGYLRHDDRNQLFFTTGIFRRRPCGGLQLGVVFDLMRDNYYYGDADLNQVRTEIGYRFSGGLREIGYFGAYGTGNDSMVLGHDDYTTLEPTDMHAFYYRRYFCEGGDGRFWGGFTGGGDGLLGADIRIPIGKSWALENRVNYLIPKQGRGAGQAEESWGLSLNLVWYIGVPARCVDQSSFRPLFGVADNTSFMLDRSSTTH
jgi:hypothetical protein